MLLISSSAFLSILGLLTLSSSAAPTPEFSASLNATNCWYCDPSQRNVFPFLVWQNSIPATVPASFAITSLEQYKSKLLDETQTSYVFTRAPFQRVTIPMSNYDGHLYQFIMVPRADRGVLPMTNAEAYGVVSNLLSQIKRTMGNQRMLRNLGFDIWAQMQDQSMVKLGGGALRDASSASTLQSDQNTA